MVTLAQETYFEFFSCLLNFGQVAVWYLMVTVSLPLLARHEQIHCAIDAVRYLNVSAWMCSQDNQPNLLKLFAHRRKSFQKPLLQFSPLLTGSSTGIFNNQFGGRVILVEVIMFMCLQFSHLQISKCLFQTSILLLVSICNCQQVLPHLSINNSHLVSVVILLFSLFYVFHFNSVLDFYFFIIIFFKLALLSRNS